MFVVSLNLFHQAAMFHFLCAWLLGQTDRVLGSLKILVFSDALSDFGVYDLAGLSVVCSLDCLQDTVNGTVPGMLGSEHSAIIVQHTMRAQSASPVV